jgi:YidC/Oxa1 family membrane protein insertase
MIPCLSTCGMGTSFTSFALKEVEPAGGIAAYAGLSLWQTFVQWFTNVIQFLYGITVSLGVPSYALAIILMTILIKLLLFPINQKQLKSMRGMQEIQPRMKQIQERYKDEPEVMQRKLAELYKESGVNPLAGCLPLLLQMPIFIAFYQSLLHLQFAEPAHAAFFWIANIGQRDPLYILALLSAATTYLQQRVTVVNADDPTQKSMMYMMPLMMAWIAASVPAGLALYWVTFNILGILQQLLVNYSHKQAKMVDGTGMTVAAKIAEPAEASANESVMDDEPASELKKEPTAGRDKGGKNTHGRASSRKKRKKR